MHARRSLLHLAALAVVVAVSGHLLMHLQPHATAGETAATHAAHAAASSAQASTGLPDGTEDGHAHLMAALCMAVLAVAALGVTLRHSGLVGTARATRPTLRYGVIGHPLRAPPEFLSRVDAGVLLRV
jgi:hypothetical protein